ncbi:hypothetical protein [Pseudovibrio axinellae]|nr:hypothetical protein [Pseudovibrio axinellae]
MMNKFVALLFLVFVSLWITPSSADTAVNNLKVPEIALQLSKAAITQPARSVRFGVGSHLESGMKQNSRNSVMVDSSYEFSDFSSEHEGESQQNTVCVLQSDLPPMSCAATFSGQARTDSQCAGVATQTRERCNRPLKLSLSTAIDPIV